MSIEFDSAEETRALSIEYFEKKKKKETKSHLKEIKKCINYAVKNGESRTQVEIPKYLEEDIQDTLKYKGYKVNHAGGGYLSDPLYTVSWEDEGE
ncbi:hypothetical protein K0O13_08275 [Mammaliicoccus sciuri]|uniref:hypothetical protein n=1 Tax=Mammaliicoccus sciuri TaxID=1296 RepID=UPI001C631D29|nr:hypothetical protein [Mammaliicoccus sciuri]QYG30096.1 hypothetical protein K0O13_08275 [Mammaliicoccus sciuri]